MIRRVIKDAAATLGFEALEAKDGLHAMEVLAANRQDIGLVLMDWNMPGPSGYEVLKQMKADQDLQHIPVMMVTTEGESKNIVMAIQAGAVNYLTKPFAQEDLAAKILESLGLGGM
jgi:two-component system chemotaxis response regulator CheY